VSDFEQPDFDTLNEIIPEPTQEPEKTPYERALSLANSVLARPLDDDQATRLAGVFAQLAIANTLERVETGILRSLTSPLPGDGGDVEGGP